MLFFANFLAILFISSCTFTISGFTAGQAGLEGKTFFKRYLLAALSLILIAFFLTHELVDLLQTRSVNESVKKAVRKALHNINDL